MKLNMEWACFVQELITFSCFLRYLCNVIDKHGCVPKCHLSFSGKSVNTMENFVTNDSARYNSEPIN